MDEVTAPGTAGRGGTLEDVVIGLIRSVACRASVVIAVVPSMKTVTRREVVEAEFGEEVAALVHFGEDTAE